ncbi:MAG: DsrE family protein [Thermodesulfovibrionales bacterium]
MRVGRLFVICMTVVFLLSAAFGRAEEKKGKDEETIKIVYHCDFSDPVRFDGMLKSIATAVLYATEKSIPYDVRVVVNAMCTQFMLKDRTGTPFADVKIDKKLQQTIDEYTESLVDGYDVKFEQCEESLKRLNIKDKTKLKPFVRFHEASQVRLWELQRKGYAYIKVR